MAFTRNMTALVTAFLLSVALLPLFGSATAAAGPLDSASSWARGGIESALEKGFVPYDVQNHYTNVITRQEFCRMAVKFVEYATGRDIDAILLENGAARNPNAFADTRDSDILAAFALGITSGTGDNQFSPDAPFSREQAATMIRNVCKVIGADIGDVPDAGYADIGGASSWAVDSINYCYSNKIMTGTSTAPLTFSPKETYTREQSIITFHNIDSAGIVAAASAVVVPRLGNTQAWGITNWAGISSVQQFAYRDEGLAYAYEADGILVITTPRDTFRIEMKYPRLGDVISDDDGNFYVVWGASNETDDASIETTFISKYTPSGQHVKTTGFVGASSPWGNSNSAKTKVPFDAGSSVSVIANGVLVNYHGKERYDGHQSDQVIAVNLSDLSVHDVPNNTYSGHSFNQSVIYCDKISDFLFASHGDAYARGFRVNDSGGSYGDGDEILFHFYLEANAGYNMFTVNKTFAQLGGLVETSAGVALVGASAKSIGEAAKTEPQNLFVQIFDPGAEHISADMFTGGTPRSGATSFDINDSSNSPLTPVTDYGVHWLTHYTDKNVVAPQVVAADDKLVILWSTYDGDWETPDETFYMVLSSTGEVLTPATSLGAMPLNSYEQPVYWNGSVYWASVTDYNLSVRRIDV